MSRPKVSGVLRKNAILNAFLPGGCSIGGARLGGQYFPTYYIRCPPAGWPLPRESGYLPGIPLLVSPVVDGDEPARERVLHQVECLLAVQEASVSGGVAREARGRAGVQLVDDRGAVDLLVATQVSDADVLPGDDDHPVPPEASADLRGSVLNNEDARSGAISSDSERNPRGVGGSAAHVDDLRARRRAPAAVAPGVGRAGRAEVGDRVWAAGARADGDVGLWDDGRDEVEKGT